MSVNAVHLIGLVAARPALDRQRASASLLVVTARSDGALRECHRVVAERGLADVVLTLSVGQTVFVAGSLQRDHARRLIVVAGALWALGDAPGHPVDAEAQGTHASPREHERVGHWRRVFLGSPREHLVWVRSTTVRRGR